jgi:hypothetical protein
MAIKPWTQKDVLERRRSTEKDYPPKRKKHWMDSFERREQFHEGTYRPFGYPVLPPKGSGCKGRVLRPLSQVTWECGGELPKTFQTSVSGAVGNVTYSMDPFWSEVNENSDLAVIDASGIIQIGDEDTEVCQGPYPPWIIYTVCDDCGCSHGTIWLEDCSADCDLCIGVDCDLPSLSGADTIGPDTTGQYTLDDAQGDVSWAISGSGFSIDQNGLVTTSSACGTGDITATDSCCGEFTKKIRSTDGIWNLISHETGGIDGVWCTFRADTCANAHGASSPIQSDIINGLKYEGRYRCMSGSCTEECEPFGPAIPPHWPNVCVLAEPPQIQYVHYLDIFNWICP